MAKLLLAIQGEFMFFQHVHRNKVGCDFVMGDLHGVYDPRISIKFSKLVMEA